MKLEKSSTLRLERDKTYVTRNGTLVVIDCLNTGYPALPVLGHVKNTGDSIKWASNGGYLISEAESRWDIIAEHVPPVTVERDVVFYQVDHDPQVYIMVVAVGATLDRYHHERHRQKVTYVHTQKT